MKKIAIIFNVLILLLSCSSGRMVKSNFDITIKEGSKVGVFSIYDKYSNGDFVAVELTKHISYGLSKRTKLNVVEPHDISKVVPNYPMNIEKTPYQLVDLGRSLIHVKGDTDYFYSKFEKLNLDYLLVLYPVRGASKVIVDGSPERVSIMLVGIVYDMKNKAIISNTSKSISQGISFKLVNEFAASNKITNEDMKAYKELIRKTSAMYVMKFCKEYHVKLNDLATE